MEGLHHDTVLDVPRSVTKEEDPMPSPEKTDEADQQKQEGITGDKSVGNDAPKASDTSPEEGSSGNIVSSEDAEPIPEKTDDDDERQVENEALVSSWDDASAETDESPLVEDGAAATAPKEEPTLLTQKTDNEEEGEPSFGDDPQETNEAPHADDDTGKMVSGKEVTLYSEKTEDEESQDDEEGEPSSSDDSPEINESSSPAPSGDNYPQADTLIQSLAEYEDDSTVSNEEETLRSEKSGSAEQPQLKEKIIPISKVRKQIAASLIESKTQIPHFHLQCEINAGPLLDARFAINKKFSEQPPELGGFKVTINDLVLKASAEAIRWVPEINASWEGDHIKQHGAVHLAFSVAVEDGLITPVIHDAETKHLRSLAVETKQLISKARTKTLSPEEMSGSTFTVTNLGMYGVDFFSGVINPPNAAILSVGATKAKPIVDDLGRIVSGRRMMLGLSCDQRVVDGAIGASFLKAIAEILESPTLMLV
jgi:pyruvate/2-oxoglutarate dehydrogenase complex dihydrolipoamide acyltransferase (E2) component